MNKRKPKWDMLSDERRSEVIDEIISFFNEERGEEIGVIAAENVLDFLLEKVADDIYNKAIKDAKNLIKKRMDDFEVDLELLISESI